MTNKTISIIIPSFNQGEFIERTILSVISQNCNNYELIVIDGGSTDVTLEILKKYESYFSHCIIEKDSGQSEAINKGFKIAKGEFVTWLNSDDLLLPNVLSELSSKINNKPSIKLFFGNTVWMNSNDQIIQIRKGESYKSIFSKQGFFHSYGPSAFFHKSLLYEYGFLREDFHYMMDTEFWFRLNKNAINFYRLNSFCWALRLHEKAKMSGHNFSNSELANLDHPSFKIKEQEREMISQLYQFPNHNTGKLYRIFYFLHKWSSIRVLYWFSMSYFLKGKNIKTIYGK